ncbi:MAG: galactokinase, partial [Chloroflexi bacterium]|nr:galactokinase [Chloroflexota bacterium]
TDYNGGFVLPTPIPQHTRAYLTPGEARTVHVRSDQVAAPGEYAIGDEQPRGDWLDYVQGVTWALGQAGFALSGFTLDITSDVPLGAGVSSSAALEVAVLRAIREAFSFELDDVRLALLGQQAENEFVGAQCGIMDQMVASLGDPGSALYLDTRSLQYRRLPLPPAADLVVIHSGVSHAIAGGDYNTRRAECEAAARLLGVSQLRDVSPDDVDRLSQLPEPLGRRARHVVTEDQRVLDAVSALESDDVSRLGNLFDASHASLRDDFDVSVPAVDLLVDIARHDPSVFGARMTGGGFGGAVVVLAIAGEGRQAGERITREYAGRSGEQPSLLVPTH